MDLEVADLSLAELAALGLDNAAHPDARRDDLRGAGPRELLVRDMHGERGGVQGVSTG